jgi:uncharacterized delta-60 repeat protein
LRNTERAHRDLITFVAVAALAIVALLVPTAANASFLDDGFGTAGSVDLDATPNDVVVDRTGRILVALDGGGDIVVAAFDEGGVPDTSFGGDGVATVSLPDDMTAVALDVDPNNRVIVGATHARFQGAIARLTPDGELDPAYDGDGIDFTNADVRDVLAQPDSKVVALGLVTDQAAAQRQFRFVRYTAVGDRDGTFSGDGVLLVTAGTPASAGLAGGEVAMGPEGSLVALAHFNPCCQPNWRAALTAVTTDGSLITTFGTGEAPGVARHGFYGSEPAGLAVQPDGKILFAASSPVPEFSSVRRMAQAVRLLPDGTADAGWGPSGAAAADFFAPDGRAWTTDLTLMSNGRVLLSAHAVPAAGGEGQLGVARFLPGGALDTAFGLDGMAWTSYPSFSHIVESQLAVDALGRPILAASTLDLDTGDPANPLLVRFLSSGGTPDGDGGGGGDGDPQCGNEGQPSCCDEENPCFGDGEGGVAGGVFAKIGLRVHRVVVPKTLGGLIRRGVRVLASCDFKCKLSVKVKVSAAVRDRLGLPGRVVARGTASAGADKRRWVIARLTGAAARAFNSYGGGGRLQIKVQAAGPKARSAAVAVAG